MTRFEAWNNSKRCKKCGKEFFPYSKKQKLCRNCGMKK